ncbi:hypothetical protein C8J57DRAFT_1511880 [Mycena rebaudengoi]|nr:hypothetical protein C8J57DRAFT_1511880 [Mycena rebaudengoi]
MPPLPVMELQQRFDPLLFPPSLLQSPTCTPGTRRDTFYRYRVRKMVFLITASVCDEGGLETAMPSLSEADLGIIRSYLCYILIILRSVGQRTFAKPFVSGYASDLSRKLPVDTFDFPPLLVKLCDRVRLPDPLRLMTDAWAGNQGSEKEWAPYSAKTGLFQDVLTGYDDLYMETDADVASVVSLHPYHESQPELCRSFRHHPSEFSGTPFGYLDYTSASVHPYGEVILKAIPAGVHAPSMLPEGMLAFLTPHISLIYTIALERGTLISQLPNIHPSCLYCFLLAQRFNMIAGFPAFSYDLGTRETIMLRIHAGDAICNTLHRSTNVQDLLLSHAVTCVIVVPLWDRQRIAELTKAELKDPWACETVLLVDEMVLSDNLGDMFVKALKADLEGYPPGNHGCQAI